RHRQHRGVRGLGRPARGRPHRDRAARLTPAEVHAVRVLVAPDKFKGSLPASEVAAHVAAGLQAAVPGVEVVRIPVADGGDGTLDAAAAAGYRLVPVRVPGPTGEPVDTAYAVRDDVAVVELADACGLHRLPGGRFAP